MGLGRIDELLRLISKEEDKGISAELWLKYAKHLIKLSKKDFKHIDEKIERIIKEDELKEIARNPFKSLIKAEEDVKKAIEECKDAEKRKGLKKLLREIKTWLITTAFNIKPLEFIEQKECFQGEKANDTYNKIKDYIDNIPTGVNIGIAGERGVGKSTLLNIILGHYEKEEKFFTLKISVPSKIERMDFLQAIFQEACDKVIKDKYSGKEKNFKMYLNFAKLVIATFFSVLIILTYLSILSFPSLLLAFLILLPLLGIFSFLRKKYFGVFYWDSISYLHRIIYSKRERFIQSVTLPNLIFGREVETEVREYTPSRIVSDFRQYIEELIDKADYRGVVIGIDELDKLKDEDAENFLKNIKDLMMTKNCNFIITGSNKLLISYSKGGSEFESTFDTVLPLKEIELKDAIEIIEIRLKNIRHEIGLDEEQYDKIWKLGNKNIRNIIRISRDILLGKIVHKKDIDITLSELETGGGRPI